MEQNDAKLNHDEAVHVSTRVRTEIAAALVANAKRHERSLSAELRLALRSWVESLQEVEKHV